MTNRIRASQLARLLTTRLERERLDVIDAADAVDPTWHAGFCAGLEHAQHVIKKGI
ncbi:hypothetical protein [Amycolatopsis sp. H20-H5]|uniref:hypothetical protein n=1 Tax=Amycolatopsis sp. H20-H5 TaxID=3046309 RepID=UPI002DBE963F|nr:hypothetical protein [Amycolatopsis sp. H20-H5]MEC3975934.1 hypothetical protein [Amycolatopsis sp. H20-H5]